MTNSKLRISLLLQLSAIAWLEQNAATSHCRESSETTFTSGSALKPAAPASPTWDKSTFCHNFLVNTYNTQLAVCGEAEKYSDQVSCSVNTHVNGVVRCSYKDLAMRPQDMLSVIPNDISWTKPSHSALHLIKSKTAQCDHSSLGAIKQKTESNDVEFQLTRHLLQSERLSPSVCNTWINQTTFFHVSNSFHIYFRFLDLYNVHQALLDNGSESPTDHLVLRIGSMDRDYRFPEFDRALFPGAMTLDDFPGNPTLCFKEVVLVPRSYGSTPFRCKDGKVTDRCSKCDGKGLTGSPLQTFRVRVLKACNITESSGKTSNLVIVSRKPYKRWSNDNRKFPRTLENEDEMVSEIRRTFPHVNVHVAHMEDLGICEQVALAVRADVMLGVHGAGLVHFWWLRDDATAIELEPRYEKRNPSFRMLTKLAGRKYKSVSIGGSNFSVKVNIDKLIKEMKDDF